VSSERLLTAEEIAGMLGVPVSWVRVRSREGTIPHLRLGRYVRFREEDVRAWLDAQAVEGPSRTSRGSA
jgi:excisionase family DNA binding protein